MTLTATSFVYIFSSGLLNYVSCGRYHLATIQRKTKAQMGEMTY